MRNLSFIRDPEREVFYFLISSTDSHITILLLIFERPSFAIYLLFDCLSLSLSLSLSLPLMKWAVLFTSFFILFHSICLYFFTDLLRVLEKNGKRKRKREKDEVESVEGKGKEKDISIE